MTPNVVIASAVPGNQIWLTREGNALFFECGSAEDLAGRMQQLVDDPAAIAYLKEQQWTNEFATARVVEADLRSSVRVPAEIAPLSGGEAAVTAPAAGRFVAASLVSIGTHVGAGQTLGRLEPRLANTEDHATLTSEVAQARVALDSARAEQTRAERLLADRAVPARRVEDAQRAVATAEARLRAAEARLAQRDETLRSGGGAASGNAFTIRAPIAGRVSNCAFGPGRYLYVTNDTQVVRGRIRSDFPGGLPIQY